jgi:hypothetical protein
MPANEKRELRERNSLHLHITILVEFVKNYLGALWKKGGAGLCFRERAASRGARK